MDDLEFSEDELEKILASALKENENYFSPKNYLGVGETQILEVLHNRLSKRIIESEVNDIFKEVRVEIASRCASPDIKTLHTVTKNCNKCEINASTELPKWNVIDPDIVVVIDSPSSHQESIKVMIDSFKEAGLSSENTCLTYVNRCPVNRKYEDKEVKNCSPYLHNEIQILSPKIVLTLGVLPASVIFGLPVKLKDYRGKITWLGHWPIAVTYSPMHVLRSEENYTENFVNDLKMVKDFIG